MIWLSLISAVWALMAPSRNEGERTPDARRRYLHGLFVDPFVWVAGFVLVYSAVTALNVGVMFSYDVETKLWKLLPPSVDFLPGCVKGCGWAYFAAALLVFTVYPAIAHSLNSRQAVYFAIIAAVIVVIDAAFAFASGFGIGPEYAVAYGLFTMASAAVMLSAERARRRPKEMLSAIALAGCLAALLFSGRPTVACVFVAATVLEVLIAASFNCRELGFVGIARALLLLVVAAAIAAGMFQWFSGDWESLIPVWKSESDDVLNRIAAEAWKASPWTGAGVGAFPLVAKISATAEDWVTLGAMPDFSGNGWRILLVERGLVGALALAGSFATMLIQWFRYARLRGIEGFAAAVPLLPIALAAVSVAMIFDSSAMQVQAVIAFAALAALSVNGGQ